MLKWKGKNLNRKYFPWEIRTFPGVFDKDPPRPLVFNREGKAVRLEDHAEHIVRCVNAVEEIIPIAKTLQENGTDWVRCRANDILDIIAGKEPQQKLL